MEFCCFTTTRGLLRAPTTSCSYVFATVNHLVINCSMASIIAAATNHLLHTTNYNSCLQDCSASPSAMLPVVPSTRSYSPFNDGPQHTRPPNCRESGTSICIDYNEHIRMHILAYLLALQGPPPTCLYRRLVTNKQ